jgi:ketosteroid isomerase-like protein
LISLVSSARGILVAVDERVELLRHAYESFNREDLDFSLLHPEVRMIQTSSIVGTAGVFEGHEGFRRAWEELLEGFEEIRFEPQVYEDLGNDRFLVRCRAIGRGALSGIELDAPVWHIWGFREGLISLMEVYVRRRQALEAAQRA